MMTKTIRFRRLPVIGGERVERLTLRAPTVSDRLKAERMGPAGADEMLARLVAICGGLPVKKDANPLADLPRRDLETLQGIIGELSSYDGSVEALPDGRRRVPLSRPIKLFSGVVEALVLAEPLASHSFKAARMGGNPGPFENELRVMALACGIDPLELEQEAFLLCDYVGLQEAYQDFPGGVEEESPALPATPEETPSA